MRPRRLSTFLSAVAMAVTVVALAGGCSSGSDSATSSTTTSSTSTTAAASTTTSTAAVGTSSTSAASTPSAPATTAARRGPGCTKDPASRVPDGTPATVVPDVDGDGRDDHAYFTPVSSPRGRRLVIVTAAGAAAETPLPAASPIASSVLVANVDEAGPVEILISDGRTVELDAWVGCRIAEVRNPQGGHYEFDLGFRDTGTGVGCAVVGGRRRLVGLLRLDDDGTTVHWRRTVIELSGTGARNGASTTGTFTRPRDDRAIALLSTVSCGDRTIDADGAHEPEG